MTRSRATESIERKRRTQIRVPLLIIVTSNLDFVEWGEAFPRKLLAASTEGGPSAMPRLNQIFDKARE